MNHNKVFVKTSKRDIYSFFLMIFLFSLFAIYLISQVEIEPITGCGKFCFEDIYLSIKKNGERIWISMAFLIIHLVLQVLGFPKTFASYRTERLLLSSEKIQNHPPYYLFNWAKAWSLNLADISHCTINTHFSGAKLHIALNDLTNPAFIFDYIRWIDPEQKQKYSWKFSTKYSEQELLDHPVIDFLIQQIGRSKVRIEIVEEEEKPNLGIRLTPVSTTCSVFFL